MPTPSLEKAAALAELAKKNGGVFVLATRDADLVHLENASAEIAKSSFSEFACVGCGSHFHGAAADGMTPFCVVCGHHETKQLEKSSPNIPPDSELAFLACSGCGTHSAFPAELASIGSSIHCTTCGTQMKTQAEKADLDAVTDDVMTPEVDDMEFIDVDDDAEELSETTMDTPSDAVSPELKEDPVDTVTTTQDKPNTKPDQVDEDPVSPSTTQQEVVAESEEVIDVDMMDDLEADDVQELSFVYFGSDVCLVHTGKSQIIATLKPEHAGEYAGMIQDAAFAEAVFHTAKTLGLKAVASTYGFKSNKVRVPLSKVQAKKVEASVVEKTKELSAARAEAAADMDQAIQIAAAGFAGNFWRNKTDPLKMALLAEAKTLQVRNPAQFVDRIFREHSLASLKVVVELAKEILQKPVESRNALAEAIDLSQYQPMVVKASEGEEEEQDDAKDEEEDNEEAVVAFATPAPEMSSTFRRSSFQSPELSTILGETKSIFK